MGVQRRYPVLWETLSLSAHQLWEAQVVLKRLSHPELREQPIPEKHSSEGNKAVCVEILTYSSILSTTTYQLRKSRQLNERQR
jgi:hypothetical protein